MNNNSKIAYNTLVVYGQLVISLLIGLFSVRFVLKALGEESYGVYTIVGGVISMLNVISASLSGASVRFMANSLGKNNIELSKRTFNTSLYIHLIFGFLLILVLEIGGWIMFQYFLNIPEAQISSAKIVYQFMIVSAFVAMISVPFDAIINSHENLLFLAVVTIAGQVINLLIALYLLYFCSSDKLIIYGLGMMLNQLLQRFIKQYYCSKKYNECRIGISKYKDKELMTSILKFAGLDFFSSAISIVTGQLRNIFVNMFFGVRLNAGQGIAEQVNGHVNSLSVGITNAITPQMNKSEGAGDRERLVKLTKVGVKFTTFMFLLFAIPIMLEIEFIFKIWLGSIPTYAVIFCQLIMTCQIFNKLTWQLTNAIRAVGNIRSLMLAEGTITLIGIMVVFLFLKLGFGPECIYIVNLGQILVISSIRMYCAKNVVNIQPWDYIKTTIFPIILPLIIPLILAYIAHITIAPDWVRLFVVCFGFIILFALFFALFGLTKNERSNLLKIIKILRQN